MKRFKGRHVIFIALCFCCLIGSCRQSQTRLPDSGAGFEADTALSAYIFINTECPVCNKYRGSFRQIRTGRAKLYFVFPGAQPLQDIRAFLAYDSLSSDRAILDTDYAFSKKLKAVITPQAVVLKGGLIRYSGLIDGRFPDIGSERRGGYEKYLENALISLQNNVAPRIPYTQAVGCFIEPD